MSSKIYDASEVLPRIDSTGYNVAFVYLPQTHEVIFGETHGLISHEYFRTWENASKVPALYGWIYRGDEGEYDLEFESDFGSRPNSQASLQEKMDAAREVQSILGPSVHYVGSPYYNYSSISKEATWKYEGHGVSCFGYVDGRFYLGRRHHMAIMDFILRHGYDWPHLINARQTWGWIQCNPGGYYNDKSHEGFVFRLSTDAASIDRDLSQDVSHAFKELTGYDAVEDVEEYYQSNDSYAPQINKDSDRGTGYHQEGIEGCAIWDSYTGFKGWVNTNNEEIKFPPPDMMRKGPEWLPEGLHLINVKGPGAPSPEEVKREKFKFILVMQLVDKSIWKSPRTYNWDEAQSIWHTLDDWRIAGYFPSVKWFVVRDENDPQFGRAKIYPSLSLKLTNPDIEKLNPFSVGSKLDAPGWTGQFYTVEYNDGDIVKVRWSGNENIYTFTVDEMKSFLDKGHLFKKAHIKEAWAEQPYKFVYDSQTQELVVGEGLQTHHADLLQTLLGPNIDDDIFEYYMWHDSGNRFLFGEEYPGENKVIIHNEDASPEMRQEAINAFQGYMRTHQFREAALPPFMYHHTDIRNRESIMAHGLSPVHDFTGYHAVFLSLTPLKSENGDTWKVYTKDLDLQPDITTPGFEDDWYMCYNVISPDRLRLMEPWEFDPKIADYDEDYDDYDEDEDLTEVPKSDIIGPVKAFGEPKNVDGYDVYEMQSGEYPSHHAILIDRNNHKMYINYYGHHHPLVNGAMSAGIMSTNMYESANGHYRLAPSDHEPFAEGWGWHGNEATPEEKDILKFVMKDYHGVESLKDAWETTANTNPVYEWVHVCNKASKVLWKAVWDRVEDRLVIWNTCGDEKHHTAALMEIFPNSMTKTGNLKNKGMFAQAQGSYVNINYIIAPGALNPNDDKDHVRSLLKKAVSERYPAAKKEASMEKDGFQRFMVTTDGKVLMGEYDSHFQLIHDHIGLEAADMYGDMSSNESYPFMGGGFVEDDGKILIIHSDNEPDFDPYELGLKVFHKAQEVGEPVTGEVVYKDWRNGQKDGLKAFNLAEGA